METYGSGCCFLEWLQQMEINGGEGVWLGLASPPSHTIHACVVRCRVPAGKGEGAQSPS